MTPLELRESLTDEQIKEIMIHLGATLYDDNHNELIFSTICHGGNSAKLYYFKNSKMFYCFTECRSIMSIFDIVINSQGYTQDEFHKAKSYIEIFFGIDSFSIGFGEGQHDRISDWSFITKYQNRQKRLERQENKKEYLRVYDEQILDRYYKYYPRDWINEGISQESMQKYNIRYNLLHHEIVIPHYNISSELIGVRVRNTLDYRIDQNGKYTPLYANKEVYKHPLGLNFYGLHMNKKAIQSKGKLMLVEGEKSVLQADTMFGDDNFTLALCGKSLSVQQIEMIQFLGVREVIIALDKQYHLDDTEEVEKWTKFIQDKFVTLLKPYVSVYILWDFDNDLEYKDSPTDKGKDVLLKLMKNKILIG